MLIKQNFNILSTIDYTQLLINLRIPFEKYNLKLTIACQLWIDIDKNESDIEIIDYEEITFLDKPITAFREFTQFHKQIGINFEELISNHINSIITENAKQQLIDKYVKKTTT